MSKDKQLHIRIDHIEDDILKKIGGHTAGFRKIILFYLENGGLKKELIRLKKIEKLIGAGNE